jgi:hypothetical protein
MKRRGPKHSTDPPQQFPAQTVERSTAEDVPLLLIDELEPRLTPDGVFPPGPPSKQVGWGC